MHFKYSRHTHSIEEQKIERFLEILPGALSWTIITGMVILAVWQPLAAAVFMVAFFLFWLMRLIYMNIFLILSYLWLTIEKETNWIALLKKVDEIDSCLEWLKKQEKSFGLRQRISAKIHYKQIEHIKNVKIYPPKSDDIHHLVIIPVVGEQKGIVEPGIKALQTGCYPSKQVLIVIALEERAHRSVKEDMMALKDQYGQSFLDFIISVHPSGLKGEAKVKGANVTYAAKKAAQFFRNKKIPFENVLVSCFDSDTIANQDYLSCLTYHFMITPERTRASYQPIPVYHNNIWEAPAFARIIDIGTSFFQLIESTNPKKLVTFSSHSMSFKALIDVDFWPVDMISDDSAIFWKAFIRYNGNYQVVPIYTTVSMDIATGPSLKSTFVNIYKQKRRWAWGVENFPIVIRAFIKSKGIPLKKRIMFGFKLLDSFVSWATWSFLLVIGTWLPTLFSSRAFESSTVYYTSPRIRETVFHLAFLGIVICMVISLLLLPRHKSKDGLWVRICHALEWLFIPVVIFVLSAVPALEAQTRLMLGRYMEFWVTDKYRKKSTK